MTPQETMDFIEGITGHGIIVEMCDFDDDECEIVKTSETLVEWHKARHNWQRPGTAEIGDRDGLDYVFIENAKIAKGQQFKDVLVIDCGEYRVVYTG